MIAKLTFKNPDPWSGYTVYKNCRHAIGPYVKRSGQPYTGLENEEVVKQELEKTLNIDLSPKSDFWKTFNVFLGDRDIILDTSIPEQKLKYYFLRSHKNVALGLNDRKPSANYILMQAEEEAKEQNTKARTKRKAIAEFDKLTVNEMRKALRLYNYNSTNTSPEVVESTLFKLVEEDPNKFLILWVNNKNKDTQFLIEEACAKGVLRKNKTVYKYGTDIIGYTLDEAIDYLNNPEQNDLKLGIKAQLQNKENTLGSTRPKEQEETSQYSQIIKEIEKDQTPKKETNKSKN